MTFDQEVKKLRELYFPEWGASRHRIDTVIEKYKREATGGKSRAVHLFSQNVPTNVARIISIAGTELQDPDRLSIKINHSTEDEIADNFDLLWTPSDSKSINKINVVYEYWLHSIQLDPRNYSTVPMWFSAYRRGNRLVAISPMGGNTDLSVHARANLLYEIGQNPQLWEFRLGLAEELISAFDTKPQKS